MVRALLYFLALASLIIRGASAQTRDEKLRRDRQQVEAEGFWIYEDLPRGFAEAELNGKPLLVVLRCIPCEECVQLDDDLVYQDPQVRPLLEEFVRVRIVSTNGLDLSLFQFDYDQSFAAFLLNADGVIYGRFGTRSHRTDAADDVSLQGLAQALQGALDLHAQYPQNATELAAKRGPAPELASPEKYPLLEEDYGPKLDVGSRLVQSCIHCHQIGDAQRQQYRDRQGTIPEQLLFPYPHPKSVGLILDPTQKATVLHVERNSPAAEAGFQPGDQILTLDGQPLLSIGDVQWVLHQASPDAMILPAQVQRGERRPNLTLALSQGWRQRDNISWRASTWAMRRMATGGLVLEDLSAEERQQAMLPETGMALRVRHVGQYGAHAAAHQAGFRQGDIVVAFDDRTDFQRETDLLAYALRTRRPGDRVAVSVLRNGEKLILMLPMQK